MAEFNSLVTALSGYAWPALLLAVLIYFRSELKSVFLQFQRQLASGAALKWKDFEFRAIQIDVLDLRGSETSVSRYLDFEGTGYRFSIATNALDVEKIQSRAEEVRP